jgi:molybdenum cofactor cytidylyltransferase
MSYNISYFGIIILAAGSSSRMGKPKQLLAFEGTTLLSRVVSLACQSRDNPVIVVLGANADVIKENLTVSRAEVIVNEGWEEGMASSLRKGLTVMNEKHSEVDGVLILVGDQPYLNNQHIEQLLEAQNKSEFPVAACSYAGIIGTPVLFHKSVFSELMALQGDVGAKRIIQNRKQDVVTVLFDKGIVDIDTPDDYDKLLNENLNL